jgi:hypothetical protein
MTMVFKICIIASCFSNVEKTSAQSTKCYHDKDQDGFGDPNDWVYSNPITGCPIGIDTHGNLFTAYVDNNLDCDDNNQLINPNTVWYMDKDGDTFIDYYTPSVRQCESPGPGYITSQFIPIKQCDGTITLDPGIRIDCDDNIPETFIERTREFFWLEDRDGDGFAANSNIKYYSYCTPFLPGYVGISADDFCAGNFTVDCNDNDPQSHPGQEWYLDADGDGFPLNNTPEFVQCDPPPGGFYKTRAQLLSLREDCDDQNSAIYPTLWYEDKDGDGLTTGNSIIACGQPEGYISLAGGAPLIDCDDNDPDATIVQEWYPDIDGDKHGGVLESSPANALPAILNSPNFCRSTTATITIKIFIPAPLNIAMV